MENTIEKKYKRTITFNWLKTVEDKWENDGSTAEKVDALKKPLKKRCSEVATDAKERGKITHRGSGSDRAKWERT